MFLRFSLTLIDTLDTLAVSCYFIINFNGHYQSYYTKLLINFYFCTFKVLGEVEEFEEAVRFVIRDVSFDNDVVVSVFETNIRVLGYVSENSNLFLGLNVITAIFMRNLIGCLENPNSE